MKLRNHEIEVSRESLICHGLRPRNDGAFEFKVVIEVCAYLRTYVKQTAQTSISCNLTI